jgi:hypothetical protein
MEEKAKSLIIKNIPFLVTFISKVNSYQVIKIDLERVVYFLSQFESYDRIKIIIKLIDKIDFIDSGRMTYLLKKAYDKVPDELTKNPLISSLGSIQDSSSVVCYQLLKNLFENEENTLNLTSDVNSIGINIESNVPSSIIFFDDNITSGTQLLNFFEELIDGKVNAEQVKTPLTKVQFDVFKKIPIRVCYAIQLAEESNKIINDLREKYKLDIEVYSGKIDFNNYLDYQSNTMESESESKFAREFIREISEPLYEDKNWNDATIYSRLLGYGNLGKLTVFYYNIPKSLIPVFWKSGQYNGKTWIPLFPETQQQKKMEKSNIIFDYYQLEAIKSWISSTPENRKAKLILGIKTEDGISNELSIQIPTKNIVINTFEKHLSSKPVTYESMTSKTTEEQLNSMLQSIYNSSQLNKSDYDKYSRAVDKYNQEREIYFNEKRTYIYQQSSNTDIYLRIDNKGNSAATNCVVKLYYNSGQLLLNDFYDLPKPKFDKEIPKLRDFDSGNNFARVVMSSPKFESLLLGERRDPIIPDTDYEYKVFSNIRIGHNDGQLKKIEVTRMNLDCTEFTIPYEINYDEEAETFSGELKIRFEEVDALNENTKDEIYKSIDKLK